jgi:hypothetical protein
MSILVKMEMEAEPEMVFMKATLDLGSELR